MNYNPPDEETRKLVEKKRLEQAQHKQDFYGLEDVLSKGDPNNSRLTQQILKQVLD